LSIDDRQLLESSALG